MNRGGEPRRATPPDGEAAAEAPRPRRLPVFHVFEELYLRAAAPRGAHPPAPAPNGGRS